MMFSQNLNDDNGYLAYKFLILKLLNPFFSKNLFLKPKKPNMKTQNLRFLVVVAILFTTTHLLYSQNITMTSWSLHNQCSGNFYDPGGSGANYGNNLSDTTIINSGGSGYIKINFSLFDLGAGDTLYVYDDFSTSHQVMGSPFTYTNTPDSVMGLINNSLTFIFNSDNSSTGQGWIASLSCVTDIPNCIPKAFIYPTQNNYIFAQNSNLFHWKKNPDASAYDVYIGQTSLPGSPTFTVNDTSLSISAFYFNYDKEYQLQIRPKNYNGSSVPCDTIFFYTYGCPYSADNAIIYGNDTAYSDSIAVALTANFPESIGTKVKWRIISGTGGSFKNDSTNNITFNGLAGNEYLLAYKIYSTCDSSIDTVRVIFHPSVDLNRGLNAYYPFDKSGKDLSGNDYTTSISYASFQNDRNLNPQSSIAFNGGDTSHVTSYAPITSEFSLSTWFYADSVYFDESPSHIQTIIGADGNYWLTINAQGKLSAQTKIGNSCEGSWRSPVTVPTPLTSKTWNHVVWTRASNGNEKIFVNGLLAADTVTYSGSTLNCSSNIDMGSIYLSSYNGYTNSFKGQIDEVRIYNRPLKPQEAFALYANQVPLVTDFDTISYKPIQIGKQVWLDRNIRSLHYADGSVVNNVIKYNNSDSLVKIYGSLYKWDDAMKNNTTENTQGVCPTGWHVPSKSDWDTLIAFLGGQAVAGGKLKDMGFKTWNTPNTGGVNTSGFKALPGGYYNGIYSGLGDSAYFWTSTQNGGNAYIYTLSKNNAFATQELLSKNTYISVRCVRNTVENLIPVANAGPDNLHIASIPYTLQANSPGTGKGKWVITSGADGKLTNDEQNNTTFWGTTGTTYRLTWIIANDYQYSADTVVLHFDDNLNYGLQGWYPLNGNANDSGSLLNHGSVYNLLPFYDGNGEYGKAYRFEKPQDSIVIPTIPSALLGSNKTVFVGMNIKYNRKSYQDKPLIYIGDQSQNNGYFSLNINGGALKVYVNGNQFTYYDTITQNKWIYVYAYITGAKVVIGKVVSGVNLKYNSIYTTTPISSGDIRIGTAPYVHDSLSTIIDNIRIYDRVPNDNELISLSKEDICQNPLPVATPKYRTGPGTVLLTATGTNLKWFTQEYGGAEIASGSNYITPVLTATDTFWVASNANGCISARVAAIAKIIDLNDGLVANYKFNGNLLDGSGNGYNPTSYASMSMTGDRLGIPSSALVMDGIDDSITINNIPSLTYITYNVWIKTNYNYSSALPVSIISNNDKSYIGIASGGYANKAKFNVQVNTYDQTYHSIDTINDNQWHMLTMSFDGVMIKSYIDGVLSSTNYYNGNITYNGTGIQIGRTYNQYASEGYYNGLIDDVSIYNKPLSNNEITALFQDGKNLAPKGLDRELTINENLSNGSEVDSVSAYDQNTGQNLSYQIISGNTGNVFAINGSNKLIINDNSALNYEVNSQFILSVKVTDDGSPAMSDTMIYTINLTNVNEAPVNTTSSGFNYGEDQVIGNTLFTVTANDPDNNISKYQFVSGNEDSTFSIDTLTGVVKLSKALHHETKNSYSLSIKVSDTGGLFVLVPVNITIDNTYPEVNLSIISGNDTICPGTNVTITASSGLNNYKFIVNNSIVQNNSSDTYTAAFNHNDTVKVVGTNSFSNSDTSNIIIFKHHLLPTASIYGDTNICNGQSAHLTAIGGNTYLWSTTNTLDNIFVSPADTTEYYVVATDLNGCKDSAYFTVNVKTLPPIPTLSISPNNDSICEGSNITFTTSNVGNTYIFYDNGGIFSSTSSLSVSSSAFTPGKHLFYVKAELNGCFNSSLLDSVVIKPGIIASITPSASTLCSGDSVTLTASSANAYEWHTGETSKSIKHQLTYPFAHDTIFTLVAHAINGCTDTVTQTISIYPSPVFTLSNDGPVCEGSNLNIGSSIASGGNWTGPNAFTSSSPDTLVSSSATAAMQGYYVYSFTNVWNCTVKDSTYVTVNPLPSVSLSPLATVCEDASPFALSGGSPIGGSFSGVGVIGGNFDPSVARDGSHIITYTYTDGNNCSASTSQTQVVNQLPTISLNASSPTVCLGESITYTATGGIHYQFKQATNLLQDSSLNTFTIIPTADTSIWVYVTDANGCSNASSNVSVSVLPTATPPTITPSGPTTFCAGGSVTLTSSAANAYHWSTGETTSSIVVNTTGIYADTITDANGCKAYADISITVTPLPAQPLLNINPAVTNVCKGDSLTYTATPGYDFYMFYANSLSFSPSQPSNSYKDAVKFSTGMNKILVGGWINNCVSYSDEDTIYVFDKPVASLNGSTIVKADSAESYWVDKGMSSYIWIVDNGTIVGGLGTDSISVQWGTAGFGNVKVIYTNASNCSDSSSLSIVINGLRPTAHMSGDTTICSGSNATIKVDLTGVSPWNLTYSDGTDSITINNLTDNHSTFTVNLTGNTSFSIVALSDANTSSIAGDLTGTANVTVNSLPSVTFPALSPVCIDAIPLALSSATPTGGIYAGTGVTSNTFDPSAAGAGSHMITYTYTDGNNCSSTAPQTLTVNALPATPTITPDGPVAFCNGDSVTLTSSIANNYSWSTNEVSQSIVVKTSGVYTDTITDVNGCKAYADITITVNPTPVNNYSLDDYSVCEGTSVSVAMNQSDMGFEYQLRDASNNSPVTSYVDGTGTMLIFPSTTPSSDVTYRVYARDKATLCEVKFIDSTIVTLQAQPLVSIISSVAKDTICNGATITLSATGADTYLWSTSETNDSIDISPSFTQMYTVTGTSNGCSNSVSKTITVSNVALTSDYIDNKCAGDSQGKAWVTPSGGITPYSFAWDDALAQTTDTAFNLNAGTYTVTVTDSFNCQSTANVTIAAPQAISATIITIDETAIDKGSISISANGGTAPLSYSIDSGNTFYASTYFDQLVADIYYIVVKDNNGCTFYANDTVKAFIPCTVDFSYTVDDATNKVTFVNSSSGASEYYWDFGDLESSTAKDTSHTYGNSGQYTVCLSIFNVSNNCFETLCKDIAVGTSQPDFIIADFTYQLDTDNKTILFADQSSNNVTNWYWLFGDGRFSTEQNAVHTYKDGKYKACLKVYNSVAKTTAQKCQILSIGSIDCITNASFTFIVNDGKEVFFKNTSEGQSQKLFWNFGDGTTSASAEPAHKYSKAGYYLVSLSVRDSVNGCSDYYSDFIKVGSANCKADFDYTVETATNNVRFINTSKGDNIRNFWHFEGRGYSLLENPTIKYAKPGLYNASLTVINSDIPCSDNVTKQIQVGVVNCDAQFTSYVDSASNSVYLYNKPQDASTKLYWMFGDGSISTQSNPVHVFQSPGYYSISLTAFNPTNNCYDYFEEQVVVSNIGDDCLADFFYYIDPITRDVNFTDNSKGNIVAWVWNFGDGIPNKTQNPSHQYSKAGYYNVCLIVADDKGYANMNCKTISVGTTDQNNCKADFYYTVDSASMKASFINTSSGSINNYSWNFGNNNTSTLTNPEVSYSSPGFYLVSLHVTNALNTCKDKHYELINVAKKSEGVKIAFGYEYDSTSAKAGDYPVDFVGAGIGDHARLRWDFGDGNTDSTTNTPTHVYTETGTYEVCLVAEDPLTQQADTSCQNITVNEPTNINQMAILSNLNTYPNPFTEYFKLEYHLSKASHVTIDIYDLSGSKVTTLLNTRKQAGNNVMHIRGDLFKTGSYIIKIKADGLETNKLIIKQ